MKFTRVINREKTDAHNGDEVYWNLMVDGVPFAEGEVFFRSSTSRRWNIRGSIPVKDGTEVSVDMDAVPSANKTYVAIKKMLRAKKVNASNIDYDALRARSGTAALRERDARKRAASKTNGKTDATNGESQGASDATNGKSKKKSSSPTEKLRWCVVDKRDNKVVDFRGSRRKAQSLKAELGGDHYVVRDTEQMH